MITPQWLAAQYERNVSQIKDQTRGLTHAASLLQPPFNSNCLNWVLGHIVAYRSLVLEILGEARVLTASEAERYKNGSPAVKGDGPGVLKLEALLAALEPSQPAISRGLGRMTPAELAKEMVVYQQTVTVGERLTRLCIHQSYHAGQIEMLRELALQAKGA